MTSSHLITVDNPLNPFATRKMFEIDGSRSIMEILVERGYVRHDDSGKLVRTSYFVVSLNGEAVLQAFWNTMVGPDDLLLIQQIPQGGGNSNIGTIIMTVVMVAAAVFTGGASLAVALAWGAAAGAAVALLTTMVPTPQNPNSSLGRESASPTYTISSQANSARIQEAIPAWYGRMRTYPDLAAQPYTENRGNQAILYQLFCIGQGSYEIERLQIENSDIAGFGEVQYQLVQPYGRVTLFPDNVITSDAVQGLEMYGTNEPGYGYLGPFVASAPGTTVTFIAIDVTMPNGIWRVTDEGKIKSSTSSFTFEYRLINDLGTALGPWQTLLAKDITLASQTAQMLTFKQEVAEGRYEVRGVRTNAAAADGRSGSKTIWTALRGYSASTESYGNVTMLAVVITATNNLNSNTARRINVIATRKLPTWDPVNGWGPAVATSNPAWAFCDALRSVEYGGGWPSSKINMAEVYRLSQVWASRGDQFNGVFDKTITLWNALTQIAAVGRATPVYYAGMIDLVRDEPKSIPAQRIMPGVILENTFKISYKLGTSETPDHVIVEYFDSDTWQATEVECILPGSTTNNPVRVPLFGCTNRDQAWREGMYRAAVNRDQRNRVTFSVEMEGLLLRYGDLIKVTHDVPGWGQFGRVLSFDRVTGKMITSEPTVFAAGSYVMAFRDAKGKSVGPFPATLDPSPVEGVYSVMIGGTEAQRNTIPVSDGVKTDFTLYAFGRVNAEAASLLVLKAKPNQKGETALTCAPYSASVHIADQGGDVPIPPPISDLPGVVVGPIIDSVTVEDTVVSGQQNIVATPAVGAVYYEFQARAGGDSDWVQLGISPDPFLAVTLSAGPWDARVRAFGSIFGPWATWSGTITGNSLPVPALTMFTASQDAVFEINLAWAYQQPVEIADHVEIWYGLTNNLGSATKLVDIPFPATTHTVANLAAGISLYFWIRVVDTAGRIGPWFNGAVAKLGISSTDANKILDILTEQITETQLAQELMDTINSGGGAMVEVEAIKSDLAAMYTIKTLLTVDGRTYMSGIGVGVENNQGIIESQILLAASRLAVLDPNTAGSSRSPFIVQGGQVFISSAVIADGFITNAMIGNVIQSNNYVAGSTGWQINKSGTFEVNGSAPGEGYTRLSHLGLKVYDAFGVLRTEVGRLS